MNNMNNMKNQKLLFLVLIAFVFTSLPQWEEIAHG